MGTLKEALGVALASAAIAAVAFIAGGLAWRRWRWTAYAAAYLASRALAHRAETLHLWASRLPKEPPPEGMGGLYMGPIKMADTEVVLPGNCPACGHEDDGHYNTCDLVKPVGEISIEGLLHEAGLDTEVDEPHD